MKDLIIDLLHITLIGAWFGLAMAFAFSLFIRPISIEHSLVLIVLTYYLFFIHTVGGSKT